MVVIDRRKYEEAEMKRRETKELQERIERLERQLQSLMERLVSLEVRPWEVHHHYHYHEKVVSPVVEPVRIYPDTDTPIPKLEEVLLIPPDTGFPPIPKLWKIQLIKGLAKTADDRLGKVLEEDPDGDLLVARQYLDKFKTKVAEVEIKLKKEEI
jgi:hypothetical protein